MKKNKLAYESPTLTSIEIRLEQVIAQSKTIEMENGAVIEEQWMDEELNLGGGDIQLQ